jgi:hypothetical protein
MPGLLRNPILLILYCSFATHALPNPHSFAMSTSPSYSYLPPNHSLAPPSPSHSPCSQFPPSPSRSSYLQLHRPPTLPSHSSLVALPRALWFYGISSTDGPDALWFALADTDGPMPLPTPAPSPACSPSPVTLPSVGNEDVSSE